MRAAVFPAPLLILAVALWPFLLTQPATGAPPDGIYIAAFSADPAELGAPAGYEKVHATLNLTLHNGRQDPCNVTVAVTENGRLIETRSLSIAGNSSFNLSVQWNVSGTGEHRAQATLSGGNETEPSTLFATCNVTLLPLVEHPSPWYTIPCAFLVIIVPSVAIWLLIRRAKGGEWLEKRYNAPPDSHPKK